MVDSCDGLVSILILCLYLCNSVPVQCEKEFRALEFKKIPDFIKTNQSCSLNTGVKIVLTKFIRIQKHEHDEKRKLFHKPYFFTIFFSF